jgi:putative DNA primase/helicase
VNFLLGAVGNQATVDWLQMAIGYSLTGHTREEVLFYIYGPSRSGKGTFTESIMSLLGHPLSTEVNFATFTAQRGGDNQNFDLAPLKPCRFVAASESNSYERFNEAKIKSLTGGNDVYCAFKHRDHFSYRPQFKIWLSSNQPVNADPDDDAVWGRVRLIEFPNSHLGNEDKSLKYGLKSPDNLAGLLRWAVDGAVKWYRLGSSGLPEPVESVTAKHAQRAEIDTVGQWIDECCKQGGYTGSAALYASYENWCKGNGVTPKHQKGLTQSLKRKGYDSGPKWRDGKTLRIIEGLTVA